MAYILHVANAVAKINHKESDDADTACSEGIEPGAVEFLGLEPAGLEKIISQAGESAAKIFEDIGSTGALSVSGA